MLINTYDFTLKQLLDFTQVKFSVLAKAIGYDVSYVSKWYNGIKLPSSKKVDIINQEIANCLADSIVKIHEEEAVIKQFAFYCKANKEDISFQIYDCLSKAYRFSIQRHPIQQNNKSEDVKIIIGRSECQIFLQEVIKKELETVANPTSLLITGDFCNLADIKFWLFLESIQLKASQCNVKVNLSLQKFQTNSDKYCDSIYRCLNSLLNYNFTLYEKSSDANANLIILKNKFAIHYVLNTEGFIDICTLLTNLTQVQLVYDKCTAMFSEQTKLLIPKETLGMQEFGFRDIFFTSDKFFHFLTNGVEYLLPNEVYDSIYKGAEEGRYFPATTYWVDRMKIILNNIMNRTAITLLIPTNTLVRYLETGHITVTEIHYQLTPAERLLHIKQVLKAMRNNPKIKIGVYYSTSGDSSYYNFANVSYNTNYSTGFFKKNLDYINKGTPHTALVNHPALLNGFQQFFEHMMESSNYHEYSVKDLTTLCEKYKPLIEQTIHLGNTNI